MGMLDRLPGRSRHREAQARDHATAVAEIRRLAETAAMRGEETAPRDPGALRPPAAERTVQPSNDTLRHLAGEVRRPFPFIPTHEYQYEALGDNRVWRIERDEFMVVDGLGYTRNSWDRGSGPEFHVGRDGSWWINAGGPAFEPDDMPTTLPARYVPWQDETGAWHTLAAEEQVVRIPRTDDRSIAEIALDARLPGWRDIEGSEERVRSAYGQWPFGQEPVDLEDAVHLARADSGRPSLGGVLTESEADLGHRAPASAPEPPGPLGASEDLTSDHDFLAAQEDDRLDAVEVQRDADWAAREGAAAALDGPADRELPIRHQVGPKAEAVERGGARERPHLSSLGADWHPSDADHTRRQDEHELDPGRD